MTNAAEGTMGMTRDEFMLRISAALESQRNNALSTPPLPAALVRRVRSSQSLVRRFCDEARRSGMSVERFAMSAAANHVGEFLSERKAESVVISCSDSFLQSVARKATGHAGSESIDLRMLTRDELFSCDVAITDVHAAVAETGSLVINSKPGRARLAHLVPETHIAIVRADQIVPDLLDLFADEEFKNAVSDAAYTALITGPSKTADIEGVLITGVHGPAEVHVVVVE